MIAGAAVGCMLAGPAAAGAATASPGAPRSDESAAHEAAESAAQEAAENNGTAGAGNCPNGVTGTVTPGARRGPGHPDARPTATATPGT